MVMVWVLSGIWVGVSADPGSVAEASVVEGRVTGAMAVEGAVLSSFAPGWVPGSGEVSGAWVETGAWVVTSGTFRFSAIRSRKRVMPSTARAPITKKQKAPIKKPFQNLFLFSSIISVLHFQMLFNGKYPAGQTDAQAEGQGNRNNQGKHPCPG